MHYKPRTILSLVNILGLSFNIFYLVIRTFIFLNEISFKTTLIILIKVIEVF